MQGREEGPKQNLVSSQLKEYQYQLVQTQSKVNSQCHTFGHFLCDSEQSPLTPESKYLSLQIYFI